MTAPTGCWPACGPTTCRASPACAVPCRPPAPRLIRPPCYRGDIIEDLPGVVEGIGTDGPLVVFHSWVAAYLSPERQGQLVETLRQLSEARPLHYLYAEAPIETPGLPTPPSPAPGSTSHLATALVHVAPDGSAPVRLADMHHHGKWLQWWATPTGPHGASRRAGTRTPSSVTMEADPTADRPNLPRMASMAAVASCHDCSRDVALCVPSSRSSPRSKDS